MNDKIEVVINEIEIFDSDIADRVCKSIHAILQ